MDKKAFGPRAGLAYRITDKTVFRSGWGISQVEPGKGGGQLYKNPPFFFGQEFTTNQSGIPSMFISDGIPAPIPPDVSDPTTLRGTIRVWDPNLKLAQMMTWSAGLQRNLWFDSVLDVAYVGSRGLHLIKNHNINQTFPGPGGQSQRRPFFSTNPRLGTVDYVSNAFDSSYHSLQAKLSRRAASGLTYQVSYTYSKFLSNNGNINGGGNGPPQDVRCFSCDRGPMPEDVRHRAVVSHVYELPFGPKRRWANGGVLGHILGNWNITGLWSLATGRHFTPTLSSRVSNSTGGSAQRPHLVGDPSLAGGQRTIDRYFDTRLDEAGAPFITPTQFTFGNSGRGILTGPGRFNVDLGIHRDFSIGERYRMSLRWEMFNAFNHVNFNNPNSTIDGSNAGRILGTGSARVMQLGLKLNF